MLKQFLISNFINARDLFKYELVFEELLYNNISHHFENISISIDLYNRKGTTIVKLVYIGLRYNPFESSDDEIGTKIINKYIDKDKDFTYENEVNTLTIKF